jgi:2-iminobutanoate/2-iminopropanoate deaminase
MPGPRRRISPASLPAEVAENNAYSYGVLDGDTLHISGMVAFAADGSYVGIGDIQAQAVQVFENLTAVVEAAGGSLDDVVSTTTYLAAAEHAAIVGSVRRSYFRGPVPPTSTVVVAPMAREQFLVEVAAIAHIPGADHPRAGT